MPVLVSFHERRPAQEAVNEFMNQRAGIEDWSIPQEMSGIESSATQAIPAISSVLSFFGHFTSP
jgi:hypothetical protein